MTKFATNDFKSVCEEFFSSAKGTNVNAGDLQRVLATHFPNVSEAAFRKRFRSYYHVSMSEYLYSVIMPTRQEMLIAVLKSGTVREFWEEVNLPRSHRTGIWDKYFQVSTFEKAKAKCLSETLTVKYDPSIDENLSLVCSQVLGDGSYDKVRGSFRISHGINQLEYAVYKASLFNKAFPTTKPSGGTSVCTHTQGHKYSSWYSGRLPSKICSFIENSTWEQMMDELTPFGILLYFLDDGYINLDLTQSGNTYVSLFMPFTEQSVRHFQTILRTYNVNCTLSPGKNGFTLKIGDCKSAVIFYKSFIEPFKEDIPECMHYKLKLKI